MILHGLYRSRPWEFQAVRLWHAVIAGGFLVAYLTGDEDTYAMHLFSGWLMVAAVLLRLAVALIAPPGSPFRLTRPSRSRLVQWSLSATLASLALAAFSGIGADLWLLMEKPHAVLANLAAWTAAIHIAIMVLVIAGKQWWKRLVLSGAACAGVAVLGMAPVWAGDAVRDRILSSYAAQARQDDPSFSGFDAARGQDLFLSRHTVNAAMPSCTSCHTDDPTKAGHHAKTGREIAPLAASVTPARFTDADEVEKRFTRDCKAVLGRPCTAREKGDFITFMTRQ